jgi:hypothetical protein
MIGATLAHAPGWAITEEESAKLATAITNVTQFYEVPILDEKGRAWLSLGMVAFEVYGSRAVTAIMQAKQKPRTAEPAAANIRPMRPAPGPPPPPPPPRSEYPGPESIPGQPIPLHEAFVEAGVHV